MKICPIALAAGCRKCPLYAVCPLKKIIGDYNPRKKGEPSSPDDGEKVSGKED